MSEFACEFVDVHKTFGDTHAVRGLSLRVPRGVFYAFLGPNGAGKTTSLRMLAGLLRPTQGTTRICGIDVHADPVRAKAALAYVPDEPAVYGKLTPIEFLEYVAALWRVPRDVARERARQLLEELELAERAAERIDGYSRGMKQKVALAAAMIHDPQLLMLDEPLTGLDAAAARRIKDMLLAYVRRGGTVLLTTHILEVAERLAQRIGVIARGQMLAEGTLDELRAAAAMPGATLEDVFLQLVGSTEGMGSA
ncbi:MAG: ABC transporter ATP-binding protein [Planctomycetes bacterium]|nr:ABC transporter ATP-binding protein [Planctomycetota bacterium]